MVKLTQLAVLGTALVSIAFSANAIPIIPGANGFGIETPAGSGRHLDIPRTKIIKVTNLNTEGPGSLRAALEAEGPRVVIFEVSGNIDFTPIGSINIKNPYITVAGQTAPSPGITLKGLQLKVSASDVLIQHMRIRVGDLLDPKRPVRNKSGWTQWSERDSMKVGGDRVIIDHCSFSWATDENVQTRGNHQTFRYNIFSEALDSSLHHKGGHSKGLLITNQGPADTRNEGQKIAVIGNLFAHNKGRNPAVNGGSEAVIVNNLIDDAHFAIKANGTAKRGNQLVSILGNVVKRTRYPFVARARHPDTLYYFAPDNVVIGQRRFDSITDVWTHVFMPFKPGVGEANRATQAPITIPDLTVIPTSEVEEWVLNNAGSRPLDRDPVDARVIKSVREQTGSIPASQGDVGSWPALEENYRKLVIPENPNEDDDGDGYTNLEEWLHEYATKVEGSVQLSASHEK